jgi:hypothetical protein
MLAAPLPRTDVHAAPHAMVHALPKASTLAALAELPRVAAGEVIPVRVLFAHPPANLGRVPHFTGSRAAVW